MSRILLDKVSYSSENGLILYAVAYKECNGKTEEELGIWRRNDIINAINIGKKILKAKVNVSVENNYIGQEICSISTVTIEENVYLKNSDYLNDLKKDDMIEMSRGQKRK